MDSQKIPVAIRRRTARDGKDNFTIPVAIRRRTAREEMNNLKIPVAIRLGETPVLIPNT